MDTTKANIRNQGGRSQGGHLLGIAAGLAVGLGAAYVAAQWSNSTGGERVTNGSFEEHGALSSGSYGLFSSIPGWQVESGEIELQHQVGNLPPATDGLAKLEIDAAGNAVIFQDVPTDASQRYQLSLNYSPRVETAGTLTNDLSIRWGGTEVGQLSGDRRGWQWHRFEVLGSAAQTRLELAGVGPSDGLGGLIDQVSLVSLPFVSSNLVQNPSFENHGPLGPNQHGLFASIPGWQAEQGEIEIQHAINNIPAAVEGVAKVELDAVSNTRIFQDIATEAGQTYELSLAYSPRKVQANTDTNDVEVWWGNTRVALLRGDRQGWQRYRFTVTASTGQTRLLLAGAGASDGLGGLVDDIRLHKTTQSLANRVLNSSFEEHGPLANTTYGLFSSIPGWQVETGDIELQHSINNIPDAFDGLAKLELDAADNSTVFQDIATDQDERYELSLYYSARVEQPGTDTNDVSVSWTDTEIDQLSSDTQGWQWRRYEVQGAAGQTRLGLSGEGLSDGLGGLIDRVRVKLLPYGSGNLVQNPSFEQHGALTNDQHGLFDTLPGWQVAADPVEIQHRADNTPDAVEGVAKLELDAQTNAELYQDITTVTGNAYLLSFSYSPRLETSRTDSNNVEVWWGDTRVALLRGDKQGWQRYQYEVIATDATMRLRLVAAGQSDGVGGLLDDFRLYNLVENQPPEITSQAPISAAFGEAYTYQVTATDADGDDLTYSLPIAPATMTINPASGLIDWQPDLAGEVAVTVRVEDGRGGQAEQAFTLLVAPENRAPEIVSTAVISAVIDAPYQYNVNANDLDGDTLTYSLTAAPLGMQIDPASGVISWTPTEAGSVTATVRVVDPDSALDQQSFSIDVSHDPSDLPPVLATVGNQTAPLGQTLNLQLSASDPEGAPLVYGAVPTPLPDNARFNAVTGLFTFSPSESQVGDHQITFSASDGRFADQETITIIVPSAGNNTSFTARVLTLDNAPLPGVRLEILGQEGFTNEQGIATINNIPLTESARVRVLIDGGAVENSPLGTFATVPEQLPLIAGASNVLDFDINLFPLDIANSDDISPFQESIVDSAPAIENGAKVTLTIPPGHAIVDETGELYGGRISISRIVDPTLGPAPLPDDIVLSYYVAMQPFGIRYTNPVPVSFPNVENFPPGSEMDFFGLNHDTGAFERIGRGFVSADGKTVDSDGGIVRENSWHGMVPVAATGGQGEQGDPDTDKANECNESAASACGKKTGNLIEHHDTAPYRSLETMRSLRLEYNSTQAQPNPIIPVDILVGNTAPPPVNMSHELEVGGIDTGNELFFESLGNPLSISSPSIQFDAMQYATGRYDFDYSFNCNFPISRRTTPVSGQDRCTKRQRQRIWRRLDTGRPASSP